MRAGTVDGVEIANASGHGVQLDSGSGFATKDLSIYVIGDELAHIGPTRQCVELVASDMPVIVGNDAHDADAFDEVKGGAHGGIIALNRVHDMNAGGGGILVGGDCTGPAKGAGTPITDVQSTFVVFLAAFVVYVAAHMPVIGH